MARAKIGATIKAHAEKKRPRRKKSQPVPVHKGKLSNADAERTALNLARPLRAYVGQPDRAGWQAYHLAGTERLFVGPLFDNLKAALKLVRSLNQIGEEARLTADGTPIRHWSEASGKRYKPNAKERRAARAKAKEEGNDPDLAVWLLAA